jgi:hypothetical protein
MRIGAIGGIGLIVAAVAGFLLKHTEPPQWEWLLTRVGIVTVKSIVADDTGSEAAIRSGLDYGPLNDACAYRDKFQVSSGKEHNDCGMRNNDNLLKVLRDKSHSIFPGVDN